MNNAPALKNYSLRLQRIPPAVWPFLKLPENTVKDSGQECATRQ